MVDPPALPAHPAALPRHQWAWRGRLWSVPRDLPAFRGRLQAVENNGCGGNDMYGGFYTVELNSKSKCTEVVASGDKGHDLIVCVV